MSCAVHDRESLKSCTSGIVERLVVLGTLLALSGVSCSPVDETSEKFLRQPVEDAVPQNISVQEAQKVGIQEAEKVLLGAQTSLQRFLPEAKRTDSRGSLLQRSAFNGPPSFFQDGLFNDDFSNDLSGSDRDREDDNEEEDEDVPESHRQAHYHSHHAPHNGYRNDFAQLFASTRNSFHQRAEKRVRDDLNDDPAQHYTQGSGDGTKHGHKHIRGEHGGHIEHHKGSGDEEHGSGHDDDHSHGIHEPSPQAEASAVASWLLVGFIVVNMTILYLTNSSDAQVKAYSFKVLSLILAIFCALLIEKAQHHIVMIIALNDGISQSEDVIMTVLFIGWYLAITVSTKKCKDEPVHLFAVSEGVVTHVAAFVGIEMIAGPQEHIAHHLAESGGNLRLFYGGTCIAIIVLTIVLNRITSFVRNHYLGAGHGHGHGEHGEHDAHGHGEVGHGEGHGEVGNGEGHAHSPEFTAPPVASDQPAQEEEQEGGVLDHHAVHQHGHHHPWEHIAEECEMESMAIIFGAFVYNFSETLHNGGQIPIFDCDIEIVMTGSCVDIHPGSIYFKLVWCACCFAAIIATSRIQHQFKDNHTMFEIFNVVEMFVCFSFAWVMQGLMRNITHTVVTGGWNEETVALWTSLVTRKTLNVTVFWPVFLFSIWFIDYLADHSLLNTDSADRIIQGTSLATAVLIESMYGFGISTVIHDAFEGIGSPWVLVFIEVSAILGLLAIILPAWTAYIVPTAMLPIPKREHDEKLAMSRKAQARFANQMHLVGSMENETQRPPSTQ